MFKPTGFSEEIFKQRYAFDENETWEQACMRVAIQMASPEAKVSYYREKFAEILTENLFVPGGRIWYGAGRPQPNMLNCFSLRSDLDSKEGWGGLARDMVVTSMFGGGCGTNFSDVRPSGAVIHGQKGTCPGPLELMELINGCAAPIRAGGSRRVALMFGLSLRHPDVLGFIRSKRQNGKLSFANISLVGDDTEEFIKAVIEDKPWDLSWKNRYRKQVSARELWNEFVQAMYDSAEPGFLNRELAEAENTIYYSEKLQITNPCGEVWLEDYGNCCLGHLVLPRFVDGSGDINWHMLADVTRLAVRFLDNVLSVNTFPLPEMRETALRNRRIGLGVTGFADMLAIQGLRYGSPEALQAQDKLERFIAKVAYDESILLAVEKGPFPACKPDMHGKGGFVSRMTHKVKAGIREHGIRNCALLTQAPTGTVSILSGNCSSGIEPIFAPAYTRTYLVGDQKQTEVVVHPLFKQFVEEGRDVSHFVSSHELTVREHLDVQAVAQKHVDNSVSKTINIPKDYPLEDLSQVLLEYLPKVKGTTIYREGSRGESPLTPLSSEEALRLVKAGTSTDRTERDCSSGACTL